MGRWTCECGHQMDDHATSDPNAFLAFSDEWWTDITTMADEDNNIDYKDLLVESYDVWKCPNCGSLMVFGEDDNPNRYTFYQKLPLASGEKEPDDSVELRAPDRLYRVASVTFTLFGDAYTYLCDDETIKENHYVVVPVGADNTEKIAQVQNAYRAFPKDIPYPVDKLKQVIKRYSRFDETKATEIARELEAQGQCLDLTQSTSAIVKNEVFSMLRNRLGSWWLELNGVPIPMKVTLLEERYDRYDIDAVVHIKPYHINCRTFESLTLCTDFDIDASRWIDSVSDECVLGNSWEKDGIHFGITGEESLEHEDELVFDDYSRVPYYDKWHATWSGRYGFNIAWKSYESDEDLSVDFYIT
ncbi:hypothetical protein [Streptococcus sp. zg-JUN1979]|uniref:hypothetical protein n=1 Tax=Streptococcus sp. zg-JUN1979 TaxID=3391450 RepID=UPI0039AF2F93